MALQRVVTGPKRVVIAGSTEIMDEHGNPQTIYMVDPAVCGEDEGSDFEAYKECHYDIRKLKFREGQTATYFHIRQLTDRQRKFVSEKSEFQSLRLAFQFGVTQIDDYEIVDGDGNVTGGLPPMKWKNHSGQGPALTDSWMTEADIPTVIILAVGGMAQGISEAGTPLSKPSAPPSGQGE